MCSSDLTWKTVGAVIALVVIFGLISAIWPTLMGRLGQAGGGGGGGISLPSFSNKEPAMVTVPFVKEPVNSWLALAGLLLLVIILMGGVATALLAIFTIGSRQVNSVKQDKDYQAKAAALEAAQKQALKQALTTQPPTPVPSHERFGWSATSTSLVTVFFGFVVGVILRLNFAPDGSLLAWGGGVGVLGLIVSLLSINAAKMRTLDSTDSQPVAWGTIWVILTGVLIVGFGLGLMMLIRGVS